MRSPAGGRRQAGAALIETTMAAMTLAVSLCGLAMSVLYAFRLEQNNRNLDRAAATAAESLEEIRSQSRADWTGVRTAWDQRVVQIDSAADATKDTMTAAVSDDPADLASPAGMWSAGAGLPNFWFVRVRASDANHAFANGVRMETYVADRMNLGSPKPPGSGGPGGGSGQSDAGLMLTAVSNIRTTTKRPYTTTFDMTNGGSRTLQVTRADLTMPPTGLCSKLTIAGKVAFNDASAPLASVTTSWVAGTGPSISPGQVAASFANNATAPPPAGTTAQLTLTFADGSQVSWSIAP